MLYIANTFFEWELSGLLKGDLRKAMLRHPVCQLLQYLPLIYLSPEDAVLVTERPSQVYFKHLKTYGIERLPALVSFEEPAYADWSEVRSWGASHMVQEWARSKNLSYFMPDFELVKRINSKVWNFSHVPVLPGARLIRAPQDIQEAVSDSEQLWVAKTDQGFSGMGHHIFASHEIEGALRFCQKEWSQGHALILEPWVKRLLDFSSQWHIDRLGKVELIGVTKLLNTDKGVYLGTVVGSLSELFGADLVFVREHLSVAESHLKHIVEAGYFGDLGMDAMLFESAKTGKTVLHPIVEVNARMTMSSALLRFHLRYGKSRRNTFLFQTQKNQTAGLLPTHFKKQLVVSK
jgi:hypothetical protein